MPSLCRREPFCLLECREIGYTYNDLLKISRLLDLTGFDGDMLAIVLPIWYDKQNNVRMR